MSDHPAEGEESASEEDAIKMSDDPALVVSDDPTDGAADVPDDPTDGATNPLSSSIPRSRESSSSSLAVAPSSSSRNSTGCARGGGSAALAAAAAAEAAEVENQDGEDDRESKLRVRFDTLLGGPEKYAWQEDEDEITVDTLIGYTETREDDEAERTLRIRWTWDRISRSLFASFPKAGRNSKVHFPMEEVERIAKKTWSRFAGEDHTYSTMDFLVCSEKLAFVWARKGNQIHTPVGFLEAVGRDVVDRKWGSCLFRLDWAARPKEKGEHRLGSAASPRGQPKAKTENGERKGEDRSRPSRSAPPRPLQDDGLEAGTPRARGTSGSQEPGGSELEAPAASGRESQAAQRARAAEQQLWEAEEKARRIAEFEARQLRLAEERRQQRESNCAPSRPASVEGSDPVDADDVLAFVERAQADMQRRNATAGEEQ